MSALKTRPLPELAAPAPYTGLRAKALTLDDGAKRRKFIPLESTEEEQDDLCRTLLAILDRRRKARAND